MSYDYIVIGGGSAGCILAAELSAHSSVLLLEAGPHAETHPETLSADGYKEAFINDELMHERFSVTDDRWGKRRLFMGSGRGLGGSGSINAMVYTRGAKEDFDQWPEGWRWDDVVPTFKALEGTLRPHRRDPTDWTERCIAAAENGGFRRKADLNDGDLSGVLGYEWMSYEGDRRRSSFAAYLQPVLGRPNLTVRTGA
ncbi:MAG: GMC family oxidoreductase N-terminal domain-containing protein, partial [Myxococcota bacterium]